MITRQTPAWVQAFQMAALLAGVIVLIGLLTGGCNGVRPSDLPLEGAYDILFPDGGAGDNGGESQSGTVSDVANITNDTNTAPAPTTTFTNPVPHDPNHISEKYNWKVYTAAHPRAFSVKWSSLFYNEIGCSADNATCLVDGVPLTYYQMDTGEDGLSRRLCYTETAVRNASELPNPVLVELLKDGVRVGAILLANPTNGVTGDTPGTSVSRWEPLPAEVVLH